MEEIEFFNSMQDWVFTTVYRLQKSAWQNARKDWTINSLDLNVTLEFLRKANKFEEGFLLFIFISYLLLGSIIFSWSFFVAIPLVNDIYLLL